MILILDSVSVSFCKVISILNEHLVLTLIQGRFEFTITLSLFDVIKLSDFLLFTCELTVVHNLFLDLYENPLSYFHINNVNTITIYFTFVKECLSKIKTKTDNLIRHSIPRASSVDQSREKCND